MPYTVGQDQTTSGSPVCNVIPREWAIHRQWANIKPLAGHQSVIPHIDRANIKPLAGHQPVIWASFLLPAITQSKESIDSLHRGISFFSRRSIHTDPVIVRNQSLSSIDTASGALHTQCRINVGGPTLNRHWASVLQWVAEHWIVCWLRARSAWLTRDYTLVMVSTGFCGDLHPVRSWCDLTRMGSLHTPPPPPRIHLNSFSTSTHSILGIYSTDNGKSYMSF